MTHWTEKEDDLDLTVEDLREMRRSGEPVVINVPFPHGHLTTPSSNANFTFWKSMPQPSAGPRVQHSGGVLEYSP